MPHQYRYYHGTLLHSRPASGALHSIAGCTVLEYLSDGSHYSAQTRVAEAAAVTAELADLGAYSAGQFQRVRCGQIGEGIQRGGEEFPQRAAQPQLPGPVPDQRLSARATSLIASTASESPATGRLAVRPVARAADA